MTSTKRKLTGEGELDSVFFDLSITRLKDDGNSEKTAKNTQPWTETTNNGKYSRQKKAYNAYIQK